MNNYISCIVIFKKNTGDIFIRPYKCDYRRKTGDETSMGWKVLHVLYEYNGNFYKHETYMKIIKNSIENEKKEQKKLKHKIKNKIKKKIITYLSGKIKKMEQPKIQPFYYE